MERPTRRAGGSRRANRPRADGLSERLARELDRRRDLVASLGPVLPDLAAAARLVTLALRDSGKALLFGNGGSFAQALHLEAELVGRFRRDRPPLAAIALGASQSTLSATANDFSYALAFARPIRGLGRPTDVAIAFSTSGRSESVIEGLRAAREMDMRTIAFTGRSGGALGPLVDVAIRVPYEDTPLVQEAHQILAHLLADAVEAEMFP